LPKFAQRQLAWRNLKYHQKLRFLYLKNIELLHKIETPKYVLNVWIFDTTIFYMHFLLSKYCLCKWISAYPQWHVEYNFFLTSCGIWCSTPLVGMRFCKYVPNSTRNKNIKSCNPYLLQKVVFLASKILLFSLGT
jgi:hypothetical protein